MGGGQKPTCSNRLEEQWGGGYQATASGGGRNPDGHPPRSTLQIWESKGETVTKVNSARERVVMLGLATVQVSTLLSHNALRSNTGAGPKHLCPKHLMSVCTASGAGGCGGAGQRSGKEAFEHVAGCLAGTACGRGGKTWNKSLPAGAKRKDPLLTDMKQHSLLRRPELLGQARPIVVKTEFWSRKCNMTTNCLASPLRPPAPTVCGGMLSGKAARWQWDRQELLPALAWGTHRRARHPRPSDFFPKHRTAPNRNIPNTSVPPPAVGKLGFFGSYPPTTTVIQCH